MKIAERWLRKMLSWPVLWRWACKKVEALEHTRDPNCLSCAGKARRLLFTHSAVLGLSGDVICKKCGLPLKMWLTQRRCSGKKPTFASEQTKKPTYKILEVD